MKEKIKQIFYDLKHQPVVTWVTLVATILSVFLVMVVLMLNRLPGVPFAPESNRPRMLRGEYIHTEAIEGSGQRNFSNSGAIGNTVVRELYDNLDGVERVSFMNEDTDTGTLLEGPSGEMVVAISRTADSEFFNIMNHTLLDGRYYTKEESDALARVAVMDESTARKVFGSSEAVGGEFYINHQLYKCVGVVADHSSMAHYGFAQIFIAGSTSDAGGNWGPVQGKHMALLLVKDGVDFQYIRDKVKARYAEIDTRLAEDGLHTVYHDAPFEMDVNNQDSSGTPDPDAQKRSMLISLFILLIVPAINLGSMLNSRLRRRVSELGVRRAFGCTRRRIITDILSENFIITLAGGIIGFVAGIIFISTYTGLYSNGYMEDEAPLHIPIEALVNWQSTLLAIAVCLVLNIVSASLPAWHASRLNPVNAINERK